MPRLIGLALTLLLAAPLPGLAQDASPSGGQASKATKQPKIEPALKWLAARQGADGAWGSRDKLALTGMSGLALLASGSTPRQGPYAEHIRRAIRFVLACQKNSRYRQAFTHASSGYSAIHNHGYALLFLTQCYGEAGPLDDKLAFAIKQGIKATVASQFTDSQSKASDGGFGYFLRRTEGIAKHPNMWRVDEASTTVSQIQALRGARNAGFAVPKRALERAGDYLARCVHKKTGGFVYSVGNYRVSLEEGSNRPTFAITAAGTAVLHALGRYRSTLVENGITYMEAFLPPTKRRTPFYYYGHYYAAQVMHMRGGARGKRWLDAIRAELAERQRDSGQWGPDPKDTLESSDSAILNTAWALQVCLIDRGFLPLHER